MKTTKLVLQVEKGLVNGKMRYQKYTFNKVDEAATDQLLHKTGQLLSTLQDKKLEAVLRQDTIVLTGEEA